MLELPSTPTLLLGASGTLGAELAACLAPSGAIATHLGRPRAGSQRFDARTDDVSMLWTGLARRPAAAVVMLGITAIDACARDPRGSALTNVDAVTGVIDRLFDARIQPVFVSSDAVFDGSRSWWSESDEAHPILEYGRQKRRVERHVLAREGGLVVRLPKLLEEDAERGGFLPGLVEALGRPDPMLCATDQFFTPASAADAARAIAVLLARGTTGLAHVAGPRRLSRRELLAEVMDEYRQHAPLRASVRDCRMAEVPVFEPRPLDTSMRCDRLAGQGIALREAGEAARSAVRRILIRKRSSHG